MNIFGKSLLIYLVAFLKHYHYSYLHGEFDLREGTVTDAFVSCQALKLSQFLLNGKVLGAGAGDTSCPKPFHSFV